MSNFTMLLKSQIKVKIKKKSKIPRENSRKKNIIKFDDIRKHSLRHMDFHARVDINVN